MKQSLMRLIFVSLLAAQAAPHAAWAQVKPVAPLPGIKGKLLSFTNSSLDILEHSRVIQVDIRRPLTTYKQVPSDLSHVTSTSFVGVASVRQADGREVATQIKIFPPELRGAGEGSHMMGGTRTAMTHSRMTNGSVFRPAVSHSRMTNGTVQKGDGTTLVIHYENGEKVISVPADVPVTQVVPGKVNLTPGDTVYAATTKQSNGVLTTNKIFLIAGVPGRTTME
jgi:hypothetical protein